MSTAEPVLLVLPEISPSLALEILPHGLTLNRLLLNDGKTHDILIGPYDPNDHIKFRKFQHVIVGRYANRLTAGDIEVEKDGVKAIVSPISNESPIVSLHGGPAGLDRHVFNLTTTPTLFTAAEIATASTTLASHSFFSYTSPAGDQGFPGELLVEVLVGLIAPPKGKEDEQEVVLGSVVIVYRAKLKEAEGGGKVISPVNITQHWGFNLDGSLAKRDDLTPDALSHKLTIKSDHIIDLNPVGLATGTLSPTIGTPHQHDGKPIREKFPEGGYDSYYLLTPPATPPTPTHIPYDQWKSTNQDLLKEVTTLPAFSDPKVELSSEKSGLKLGFDSNQPGVQFYSGNYLDGSSTRKKIHGGSENGSGYTAGAAAFLEFHEPLEAYKYSYSPTSSKPDPSKSTLLSSDELYHNWVRLDAAVVGAYRVRDED